MSLQKLSVRLCRQFVFGLRKLEIADVTKSRYQLYSPEMIERCIEIQRLKKQKLTLNEIKDMLVNNDTGFSK